MQLQSGKSMLLEAAVLIYRLEDDCLYAPWQVAATGFSRETHRADYDRIRLNLGEWSRYHNIRESFENRDDQGSRVGRFPAWFGKTWKEHLGYKDLEAAKRWMATSAEAHTEPAETISLPKAVQDKPKQSSPAAAIPLQSKKPSRSPLAAAVLLAAACLFYLNLAKPAAETVQPQTTHATIIAEKAPTKTLNELSVSAFAKQRQALAKAKVPRVPQYAHPQNYELTWDMKLIDEPLFQAAVLPNCVFLVSRVQKDMMPFDFDE